MSKGGSKPALPVMRQIGLYRCRGVFAAAFLELPCDINLKKTATFNQTRYKMTACLLQLRYEVQSNIGWLLIKTKMLTQSAGCGHRVFPN
jgi:hypothetical protein